MSSYYLPIPPKVWSRVQNQCTFIIPNSDYTQSFIPLTGQTVSQAQANYEDKLLYKGNILQYKANSALLTKNQKYSQLAKGGGPNRTKVFATQSQTYTNPNTTGLLRVNFETYPFPNQVTGAPNNISGPYQYNVQNPFNCPSNEIKDGGNLVCGTLANPCTNQIIKQGPRNATLCYPTYFSDVPGKPISLCWNNKLQTWFPRSRYFMNNSNDKWPQGYKGFVSALKPIAPIINATVVSSTVTLTWTYKVSDCLPITSFNIYLNQQLLTNVSVSDVNSYTFQKSSGTINIYMTSLSNTIESNPSNTITIS